MRNLILIFYLSILFVLQSCKCDDPSDPKCKNYDPCFEVQEPTADFDMYLILCCEGRGSGGNTIPSLIYDGDKVPYFTTFRAEPKYKNALSYKWQVGLEAEYRTTENLTVNFEYPWGEVDITLIVEYEIDEQCHKTRVTSDTITKTINLVYTGQMPLWGKFRGYMEDNPSHLFDIELDSIQLDNTGFPSYGFALSNLPEECTRVGRLRQFSFFQVAPRKLIYKGSDHINCKKPYGFVTLSDDFNQVKVEFTQIFIQEVDGRPKGVETEIQTFIGERIE